MTDTTKVFISYSWSSAEHEEWVIKLATELRESGVDAILDKWDLKEGHDAHAFMEKMIADVEIRKVIIVCDRFYAEKADSRSGGVGTETQILSPEIYATQEQSKFVAVLAERDHDGKPYLPIYYRSRIYIDLSDEDLYAKNFEQLLRWVYDKPLHLKPEIGKKPHFLSESATTSLETGSKFRRALEAIRSSRNYADGALREYFDTYTANLERFRIVSQKGEFDELVVNAIDDFIPFRNEAIEVFLALAQYADTPETYRSVHRFFEKLIPYMHRPEHITSYQTWEFDNFKFIVHELFLYGIAAFLKYERFDAVAHLLQHRYYFEQPSTNSQMTSFATIWSNISSLEHRNTRLGLRRLSLRADLLEQRSKASGLSFSLLMQADFVLFIRDSIDSYHERARQRWWPITLVYLARSDAFEIFARAESTEYFKRIKCLLGVSAPTDLEPVITAFKEEKLRVPQWGWHSFNVGSLLNCEN